MFDTHCHLNFKAFAGKVDEVVDRTRKAGVNYFVVPGADVETSKKAIEIAGKFAGIYAAVGIHPHHIYQYQTSNIKNQKDKSNIKNDLKLIEELLVSPKVVAVGEVGLDRHYYQKTKYSNYQINEEFIELQKEVLLTQLKLAKKYKKSIIIHNREAKEDLLDILSTNYDLLSTISIVFHCCEPDGELLSFARKHKIFIGVDGDICYRKDKQEFVKKIPLELLVLETDSPFLSPFKKFPNEPKNLPLIASFMAAKIGISQNELGRITEANSKKLFKIT